MQNIFITGNLAADCEIVKGKDDAEFVRFADCEIVKGKDDAEFVRFNVAVNDAKAGNDEKPTYYNCRMAKTGLADYLKKGRYVSVSGRLKVSTNVKEDKTYMNLDVWVSNIDLAPAGKD